MRELIPMLGTVDMVYSYSLMIFKQCQIDVIELLDK